MVPPKVKTTKKDHVDKEVDANVTIPVPLFGQPWKTIAEFEIYEEASHKKNELLENSTNGFAKIKRTSHDTFLVKFREPISKKKARKKDKHKKGKKKSS